MHGQLLRTWETRGITISDKVTRPKKS